MHYSTALLVTLIAVMIAIMVVFFGAIVLQEPIRRALLKAFALSLIGSLWLLRVQLLPRLTDGGTSAVITGGLLVLCAGFGTLAGAGVSALLLKLWKAFLTRAFPKP